MSGSENSTRVGGLKVSADVEVADNSQKADASGSSTRMWIWDAVGAVAASLGVPPLVHGLSRLRWAHLYRQRAEEGLGFFQVGLYVVPASLLLGIAAVLFHMSASEVRSRRLRYGHRALSALLVFGLVVMWALILWVEWHGNRCIGPCGPEILG